MAAGQIYLASDKSKSFHRKLLGPERCSVSRPNANVLVIIKKRTTVYGVQGYQETPHNREVVIIETTAGAVTLFFFYQ